MAKNDVREGYREIKVPDNYKGKIRVTDDDGVRRLAQPGEHVELSEKTLKHDQHLLQYATDVTPKEKNDFYSKATTESLTKALKNRNLDVNMNRSELISTAREQGVERSELELVDSKSNTPTPNKPNAPSK
jgi:hypothetical protein